MNNPEHNFYFLQELEPRIIDAGEDLIGRLAENDSDIDLIMARIEKDEVGWGEYGSIWNIAVYSNMILFYQMQFTEMGYSICVCLYL